MTIERQIKAAERELIMRKRVYARRVASGQMTPSAAQYETDSMQSILETLRAVQEFARSGKPLRIERETLLEVDGARD